MNHIDAPEFRQRNGRSLVKYNPEAIQSSLYMANIHFARRSLFQYEMILKGACLSKHEMILNPARPLFMMRDENHHERRTNQ
ncbi:MAG: hypothetical protein ACYCS1_11650, partial [Gammaproteobacteria bacterium]